MEEGDLAHSTSLWASLALWAPLALWLRRRPYFGVTAHASKERIGWNLILGEAEGPAA